MAMTTVSVIMTVIVLNFFYRGPILTEAENCLQVPCERTLACKRP